MNGDFERFKEGWSRQVLANRRLVESSIRVAWAISFHLNRNSRDAWPGIPTLAKLTGYSERQVIRALDQLEEERHVQIKRTRGRVNRYALMLQPAAAMSPTHDIATSPAPDTAMSPEPLTEPLIEPLPYGTDLHRCREKEVGEERKIFDLARSQYGQRGASLVAKAMNEGADNAEIMYELGECIENDGDLAQALWQPGLN
jgi:hypothetical protein